MVYSTKGNGIVLGRFNKLAVCVAQEAVASRRFNPIVIQAGSGLGKTALLRAIRDLAGDAAEVTLVSCREYLDLLTGAIRNRMLERCLKTLREPDFLLIDDIQLL